MTLPSNPTPAVTPDSRIPPAPGGILFFDGECGLCHRLVHFLARRDRHRRLRFAPLTGVTAAALLAPESRIRADTVVLRSRDRVLERSAAAITATRALGGAWALVRLLQAVPRPLRDRAYDWVARHRMRWFGRREACVAPAALERHAFLP